MLPQLLFTLMLASALARGPMCSDGVAPTCPCSAPTVTNGWRVRSAGAGREDPQPVPIPTSPQPATMGPSHPLVGPVVGLGAGPAEGARLNGESKHEFLLIRPTTANTLI